MIAMHIRRLLPYLLYLLYNLFRLVLSTRFSALSLSLWGISLSLSLLFVYIIYFSTVVIVAIYYCHSIFRSVCHCTPSCFLPARIFYVIWRLIKPILVTLRTTRRNRSILYGSSRPLDIMLSISLSIGVFVWSGVLSLDCIMYCGLWG